MEIDIKLSFKSRDEYKRQPIAEKIIEGCVNDAPMFPLMITGDWGTGKSEFTQKLCSLVEESYPKVKPLYVDAYKSDYHDDPLVSISTAILEILPDNKRESVRKRLIPVVKTLGKLGFKALVSYVLKQDTEFVAEEIEKDIKKSSDAVIDEFLKEKVKAKDYLTALRDTIYEVTAETKLLICIDELDRCKPTFAVNMIEIIKHIFDIQNVYFLIVVNRKQLEAALMSHYGQNVDTKRYLDKFVKFSVNLPVFKESCLYFNQESVSLEHFKFNIRQTEKLRLVINFDHNRSYFFNTAKELISRSNLSLREVETLVRYMEIYQSISGNQAFQTGAEVLNAMKLLGIFICAFEPRYAAKVIQYRDTDELLEWLSFDNKRVFSEKNSIDMLGMLIYLSSFDSFEGLDNLRKSSKDLESWVDWFEQISWNPRYPEQINFINILIQTMDIISLKTIQ